MRISALFATGIVALGIATFGAPAEGAPGRSDFLQIMTTMNNVEWIIQEIGQIRNVSDVKLVQLDDSMGADEEAFVGAIAAQQGTAQVDALRAAIAGNRPLVAELERQHIEYMNIVAVDIDESGAITVYTFGASA